MSKTGKLLGVGIVIVGGYFCIRNYDETHEVSFKDMLKGKFDIFKSKVLKLLNKAEDEDEVPENSNLVLQTDGTITLDASKEHRKHSYIDINEINDAFGKVKDLMANPITNADLVHKPLFITALNEPNDLVNRQLINVKDMGEDNDPRNNCKHCEDCSGECSCDSGKDAPREYVSEVLQKSYESKADAAKENGLSEGELHLVEPSTIGADDDKKDLTDSLRTNEIVGISAVEFTKAYAAGKSIQSFVWDTIDKKLCWNFTYVEVSEEEAWQLIGHNNYDNIVDESNFNANGWIQPRYFYDTVGDVYIKIEVGNIPR